MNRKVITINKKLRYPAKLKSGVAEQYMKISLVVISPKKTNNMVQSSLHEQNSVDDVSEEAVPVTTPLESCKKRLVSLFFFLCINTFSCEH